MAIDAFIQMASGIYLPDPEGTKTQQEWEESVPFAEPIVSAKSERVRQIIANAMQALDEELCQFEQTTHGSLYLNGITMKSVGRSLVFAYDDPTSYNLSELSQAIHAMWPNEKTPPDSSSGA